MILQSELGGVVFRMQKIRDKIPPYARQLKEGGGYKDFAVRLSWDILRAVVSTGEICSWYDKYGCNDSHITTLAKAALKAVCSEVLE